MSNNIVIKEELRDLIPPLSKEELKQLHTNLDIAGKARDPLIVWKNGEEGKDILIDGHHRFAYCTKNNLDFQVTRLSFSGVSAVKVYMIKNQLGKRNLSPKSASLLRGMLYNSAKKTKEEIASSGGKVTKDDRLTGSQNDSQLKQPKTREVIAKQTGVSPQTVQRDAKFLEAVEELDIKKEVMSNEDKRPAKEIIEEANIKKGIKPKEKPKPKKKDQSIFKGLTKTAKNQIVLDYVKSLPFSDLEDLLREIDEYYQSL